MDLRKSFEEQEKGLLFGEETGNAFGSNFNNRWACEWPRNRTSSTTRLHTGYLAPLTPSPPFVPTASTTGTQQSRPPHQKSPQQHNFNNNDPLVLVSLDPLAQNQNQPHSSDDDDDGGDDQDEESDSTDSSVSTDADDRIQNLASGPGLQNITIDEGNDEDSVESSYEESNDASEGPEELTHVWPEGRPLPYPAWESKSPQVVHFSDILQYEEFAGFVEFISQQTVAGHKYNTVENFIRFYRAFKKSKIDSLENFYRQYQSPMTPCHYTCVGLAYELIQRINDSLPRNHEAINRFYITSCEEAIETAETYVENIPPDRETVEKEHVSVCLKIQIGEDDDVRNGYLFLDPGYHISRVVTIMEDGIYPHTGRFVQSDDGLTKKEYEYTLISPEYMTWEVTDTKKGKCNSHTSLIFVARGFLSGIDFTERRNLVYDFKSVLRRDPKGQVIAGLYFPLNNKTPKKMTIFFMENNNRTTFRMNVTRNVKETKEIQTCEEQMGLKRGKLTQMMNAIGKIMHDEGFMDQTLQLNDDIVRISAEN